MFNYSDEDKISCQQCEYKSCPVSVLNESQLEILNAHRHESDVKKGEIILRAGALATHIVYLKTGFAKEYVSHSNGKSKITQIVKNHSYLGLHSLFGDKINHFSYTALEDLKICYIDINIFKQFIKEEGNFAYEVLAYVCRESLQNSFSLINQGNKRLNGKFADTLLYFAESLYNDTTFILQLSRQEIADLIGISRENATRVLTKFKKDGIINVSGKKIEILKIDLLRKISRNG